MGILLPSAMLANNIPVDAKAGVAGHEGYLINVFLDRIHQIKTPVVLTGVNLKKHSWKRFTPVAASRMRLLAPIS
jgi:hypothetical protein